MTTHKEIEKIAYELYEKGGRVHGRALEHWCEAERIVRAAKKTGKRSSGARPGRGTAKRRTAGRAKKA